MAYQTNSSEHSKLDIERIDDSLLAGLYSSGHSNLETIDNNLFNLIINKEIGIIKANFDEKVYLTTILTSVLQVLIDSEINNILFITSDKENETKYLELFNKLSSYLQNVFILNLEDYVTKEDKNYSHLIITDVNNLSKSVFFEKINLIIVEDCNNDEIIDNIGFDKVNRIIISKKNNNLDIIEKTITKPENKSVIINEDLNEEKEFDKDQEPININLETSSTSVDDSSPVVEESTSVDDSSPVVEESTSVVNSSPVVEESTSVDDSSPVVEESTSVVKSINLQTYVDSDSDVEEMSTPVKNVVRKKINLQNRNRLLLLRGRR